MKPVGRIHAAYMCKVPRLNSPHTHTHMYVLHTHTLIQRHTYILHTHTHVYILHTLTLTHTHMYILYTHTQHIHTHIKIKHMLMTSLSQRKYLSSFLFLSFGQRQGNLNTNAKSGGRLKTFGLYAPQNAY